VCFLCHFPSGHPAFALRSTLPCGARTFLTVPEGTPRPSGLLAISIALTGTAISQVWRFRLLRNNSSAEARRTVEETSSLFGSHHLLASMRQDAASANGPDLMALLPLSRRASSVRKSLAGPYRPLLSPRGHPLTTAVYSERPSGVPLRGDAFWWRCVASHDRSTGECCPCP
jgi:hypothetical protein